MVGKCPRHAHHIAVAVLWQGGRPAVTLKSNPYRTLYDTFFSIPNEGHGVLELPAAPQYGNREI